MILTISLPDKGKMLFKVGQHISIGDPFNKTHVLNDVRIAIAAKLNIEPRNIFKHLKKNIGDKVNKDELMAEKKSLFSLKQYKSEYEGLIKEIDHIEGIVLLEVTQEEQKNCAYFTGEVVEINKQKLKLKVGKGKVFDVKDISVDFGGPVVFQKENPNILTEEEINKKVYCSRKLLGYEQMKIEALGAVGIISLHSLPEDSSIPFAQISEIKQWDELVSSSFLYCIADKKSSKIYFYS